MSEDRSPIDVLLLCALKDEYDQVLAVKDGLVTEWHETKDHSGRIVADGRFSTLDGNEITIRATWVAYMGREQAQAVASAIIAEVQVKCIAMSGICAGRRGKIELGDVIFADRLWSYDAGKCVVEEGREVFQGDMLQFRPSEKWVQHMQTIQIPSDAAWLNERPLLPYENQENWVLSCLVGEKSPVTQPDFDKFCPDWAEVLPRLWKREWVKEPVELSEAGRVHIGKMSLLYPKGLPQPAAFRLHVAPLATGAAVKEDENIFSRISVGMRKVLGIDMEASGLAALAEAHNVPVIVAKGVSDFGDLFKDDRYRKFAARAAAEALIRLLRHASHLFLETRERRPKSSMDGPNAVLLETVVPTLEALKSKFDELVDQGAVIHMSAADTCASLDADAAAELATILGSKSADLLSWQQVLPSGEWIERPEMIRLLGNVYDNDNSITLLLGGPGSGKSALLSRVGNDLVGKDFFVLAIKADLMPRSIETLTSLQEWLQLPAPVEQCLERLSHIKPVVILIDQLDALCDLIDLHTGRLSTLLELSNALAGHPNIHLMLSCREFEFRHDVRFQRLDADEISLALPSWEDISTILSSHRFDTNGWPRDFREILCTPQYLSVFIKFLGDESTQVFSSYQSMLEEVWRQKVVGADGNTRRAEVLQQLAGQMADCEELWAPIADFDSFSAEIQQLESSGILKRSQDALKIGFSHQTIFDFTRARAFTSAKQLFSDYVLERQDALFIRPTLWSTLVYLRGAKRSAYHHEFEFLWSHDQIRTHVRFLMTEFLGQLSDPDDQEAVWLLPDLEKDDLVPKVLWVTQGSQGWFELIRQTYLPSLMTNKGYRGFVTPFLSRAWQFAKETILSLLEEYWLPSPDYDVYTFQALEGLQTWDNKACEITEKIISRTALSSDSISFLASAVSVKTPQLAPRLISAQLTAEVNRVILDVESRLGKDAKKLEKAVKLARSKMLTKGLEPILENSHWYDLPAVADSCPCEFLEMLFPWFVRMVDAIAYDSNSYVAQYRGDSSLATSVKVRGDDHHDYPIIMALQGAIVNLAEKEPDWLLSFVTKWETSDLLAVHRMLVLGLTHLSTTRPDFALSYLLSDSRRLGVGSYSDEHEDTKNLIAHLVPQLSDQQVNLLEEHVIKYSRYLEVKNDGGTQKEKDIRARFNRSKYDRQHRLRLLRAFPKDSLSPSSQRLVQQEERALGPVGDWDFRVGEGGFIGSPVSASQMEKAKDDDILGLFDKLNDATGWDHPRLRMKGGSIQAAREFCTFAKADPERALQVIRKFHAGIHERPVAEAVRGLADEGKIQDEDLFALILELEQKGFSASFYRENAAYALEKAAKVPSGLPDNVCQLLRRWLAPYDTSPTVSSLGSGESGSKEDSAESVLWVRNRTRVLPGGNLPILQALCCGYLLRRPCPYEIWLEVLEEHLEQKENVAVWETLADDLRWLQNADRERSERLIQRVLNDLLIQSEDGAFLIARNHHWISPNIVHGYLKILQEGSWEKGLQIYGELIVLCFAAGQEENVAWYWEMIEKVLKGDGEDEKKLQKMRLGCAHSAARLWGNPEFRSKIAPIITRLIPIAKGPIASAILKCFDQSSPVNPDGMTRALLDAIIAYPAILKDGSNHFFVSKMSCILPLEAERVYQICSALLTQRGEDVRSLSNTFSLAGDELIDISLTLQRINSHRAKGLELFERLLGLEAYGIRDTLFELDRRPCNAAPIRPRRRRKRPSTGS